MVVLASAAPAAAVSGAGFGNALWSGNAITISARTGKSSSPKTCQARSRLRRVAVVACEQPPRSQLVTPAALRQATTAALATLG